MAVPATNDPNILERLKGPSYQYFLGTDHFGRDIFSMLLVGGQTSISVANG